MSKYLLILDSGHAKNTAGKRAFDNSLYEWDFNNKMQYALKERVEQHGITVRLTNPNPSTVSDLSLSVRSAYANKLYSDLKKPNTLFISLHANAYGSTWNTARGVEVYHASNASQNSKNVAKYLCDSIYNDVKNIDTSFKNRGVKCQDFTVIYKTIMVSLHANAYGRDWNSARGVEVYHASNASNNSKNLAKYICDNVYNDVKNIDTNFKNRGVKCQDFTVIYKTITPCVLVEYAFYSNKDDLKILKNNQSDLVEATMKGICKYFGVNYQEPKKEATKTESSNTYYRVVAGSYTNRANADKLVSELKNKGYNAFIDIYKK